MFSALAETALTHYTQLVTAGATAVAFHAAARSRKVNQMECFSRCRLADLESIKVKLN